MGNKSGKYVSQKPVTFQDLALVIRTRFVSQDEKNKTKPQWEIIHRGNKIMDFPDLSPQTWLEGALLYFSKYLKRHCSKSQQNWDTIYRSKGYIQTPSESSASSSRNLLRLKRLMGTLPASTLLPTNKHDERESFPLTTINFSLVNIFFSVSLIIRI